jgi:hypothetical protein
MRKSMPLLLRSSLELACETIKKNVRSQKIFRRSSILRRFMGKKSLLKTRGRLHLNLELEAINEPATSQ